MKRIYSNYSEEDFKIVTELANELGFSLSSFQHYCVMLYADSRGNTTETSSLWSELEANMKKIKVGQTFIVSALLPDKWPTLNRSVKMTLAKQLSLNIRNKTNFSAYTTKGKTTVYKRNS